MSATETLLPLLDMEYRAAEDRHYIEGIAVPWQRRTDAAPMPEMFERGAFADLVASNGRVKLTDYNHSKERIPVGYSTLVEDRQEGLWMRFHIYNTPEGESARRNVSEGVYGGLSIGFLAREHEIRNGVRHVKSARMHHVSLVEEPAYQEAVILEMRSAMDAELSEWRALIAQTPALDTRPRTSQNLLIAELRRRSIRESR